MRTIENETANTLQNRSPNCEHGPVTRRTTRSLRGVRGHACAWCGAPTDPSPQCRVWRMHHHGAMTAQERVHIPWSSLSTGVHSCERAVHMRRAGDMAREVVRRCYELGATCPSRLLAETQIGRAASTHGMGEVASPVAARHRSLMRSSESEAPHR